MQSLKVSLNLLLNNQKHNQNNFCKKQSLNLQLNKVFSAHSFLNVMILNRSKQWQQEA